MEEPTNPLTSHEKAPRAWRENNGVTTHRNNTQHTLPFFEAHVGIHLFLYTAFELRGPRTHIPLQFRRDAVVCITIQID